MSKFVSSRNLLLGILIASSLGVGYAIGQQPHMEATLAILQEFVKLTAAGYFFMPSITARGADLIIRSG